jgi:hypothetical protein
MEGDMRALIVASAALVAALVPGVCEAQDEEIVVTGSRRAESYESLVPPTISLKRRADFAIVELTIRNDTRDLSQRLGEMREALRGLQSRARTGSVTLAIVDEDVGIVRAFSLAAAEDLIRADRRADSSVIAIRLRTPVSEDDTLESVQQRVESFVDQAPKPGRTEMELGESQLTMVGVDRYREPLLQAIAQDGRRTADLFGAGYSIAVSGIENQVAWLRTGDLELTLFIRYSMSVERGS